MRQMRLKPKRGIARAQLIASADAYFHRDHLILWVLQSEVLEHGKWLHFMPPVGLNFLSGKSVGTHGVYEMCIFPCPLDFGPDKKI